MASGLKAPPALPPTTTPVLLYRAFAVLSALTSKTPEPYEFQQAYIDSSGDDGGPNDAVNAYPQAARHLQAARTLDTLTEPGLRYWMVSKGKRRLWAFERDQGLVWTTSEKQTHRPLMQLYNDNGRRVEQVVLALLTTTS